MLTELTDLYVDIVPEVPHCPRSFLSSTLKRTCRSFFSFTENWTKEIEDIDIVADQAEYELDPAITGTVSTEPSIKRIRWVKISGAEQDTSHYELIASTGEAAKYSVNFKTDYVPTSAVTDGLDVKVVLCPDWRTDVVPDILLTQWGDVIVAGTLMHLLGMKKRSWTDLERKKEYEDIWKLGLNSGVRERYTEHKDVGLFMDVPSFT